MCAVLLLRWGLKSDWRKEKVSEIFKMKITTVLGGRNVNNLRYADDTTLMAESEEELKSLLMQVKEESEKAGLKLNIQNTKIWFHRFMANRWGNNGNSDFIFGAPKSLQMVTAALELKDTAPWKKSYDKSRQHIQRQRHYFADKGPSSQSYGFSSSPLWK